MSDAAPTFFEVLTAAINEISTFGYRSAEQIGIWIERLRLAAERTLTPPHVLEDAMRSTFGTLYKRYIEAGKILELHPGVQRFTIEKVKPILRPELDRRIAASADLIKLNRQASIEKTMQRFSGWATSVPPGGTETTDKVETKKEIRKALASLPFEERRVLVDQGHKFVANLSNIIATDTGAIAAIWQSHWRQKGYNYRKDHKERDGKVYLIRGSWAQDKGFVKPGLAGYLDAITQPGEEVFCRCWTTYLYAVRSLPDDMITQKGKDELRRVKLELMNV